VNVAELELELEARPPVRPIETAAVTLLGLAVLTAWLAAVLVLVG